MVVANGGYSLWWWLMVGICLMGFCGGPVVVVDGGWVQFVVMG